MCDIKTTVDVETAVAALNGSELGGESIEVALWPEQNGKKAKEMVMVDGVERTKKALKEKAKRERKKSSKVILGTKFQKPVKTKLAETLSKIDPSLKVWIGGLPEAATRMQVEKHFTSVAKPDGTDLMKKGTACVAYNTTEDVESAIEKLNGSQLGGKTITVDAWKRPEMKNKERRNLLL